MWLPALTEAALEVLDALDLWRSNRHRGNVPSTDVVRAIPLGLR
jgi:hypothetical protein